MMFLRAFWTLIILTGYMAVTAGEEERWCESAGGCDEYIARVIFCEVDNSSGCVGYSQYNDPVAQLEIGGEYFIEITTGNAYSRDSCGIWVDWNHDFLLDPLEEEVLLDVDGGYGPYTGYIRVPTEAETGECVLRIRLCYNQVPEPCGITTYGEVEDYLINVSGTPYKCGDANGDWQVNVGDVVYIINYVFTFGPAPYPIESCDCNGDAECDSADAVYLINFVFKGGSPPVCN